MLSDRNVRLKKIYIKKSKTMSLCMVDPDLTGVQDHFSIPETFKWKTKGFNNPASAELVTHELIISVQKLGEGLNRELYKAHLNFHRCHFCTGVM